MLRTSVENIHWSTLFELEFQILFPQLPSNHQPLLRFVVAVNDFLYLDVIIHIILASRSSIFSFEISMNA